MKTEKLYAIVDIETTGAYAGGCRMTEIAILVHNGIHIVEEYQTLVNPQQPIPHHIQVLTGIDDTMVCEAPVFEDIAATVFKLLEGKVFVAHNVNFDYSFIYNQLQACGYILRVNKLCTVRLSRKFIPGLPSYSLGKLCNSLGIVINDRHRAYGDACATAILFQRILDRDKELLIEKELKKGNQEYNLPSHLSKSAFENLPQKPGVYFFRDRGGKLIYVGKAINIKKRVYSHFTGNNMSLRRQLFIKEICHIDFEETGTELIAFLKECHYIKQHWPAYNRALKQYEPKFGLIDYVDNSGYLRLCVAKMSKGSRAISYFNNISDATQCLLDLIKRFELDTRLCVFYQGRDRSALDKVERQIRLEDKDYIKIHNNRIEQAIDFLNDEVVRFLLLDKGRDFTEKSYIYFKENRVHAVGYLQKDSTIEHIENHIKQEDICHSNFYMCQLVRRYAEKNPEKVRILSNNSSDFY